jgi:hypothetical protein
MSQRREIGAEFDATTFTHEGRTHDVLRAGSGPGVVVIHEVPGCIRVSSSSRAG